MDSLTKQDAASPGDRPTAAITTAGASKATTLRITLAALWTALILVLCWMPRQYVMETDQRILWFTIPNLDKLVHWGIFLIFGILWVRASGSRFRYLHVALAGLALAVITEVVQSLPPIGRDCNLNDGLADLTGLVLGLALVRTASVLARIEAARNRRPPVEGGWG